MKRLEPKRGRRSAFTPVHWILFSFLLAIGLGALLLSLPVSRAPGAEPRFSDAVFTAATSVCVTGLVTVPTAFTWSVFGQIVILLLIQIGGLGVITCLAGLMIGIHRRMGLGDRLLLQDAFNLNTLSGIVGFVRRVILGTLAVEGSGALLCMPSLCRRFGARGIWYAVFHAISAFCNAGIDLFAADSLCSFRDDALFLSATAALIVLGGLGFPVWWDVLGLMKKNRSGRRRRACSLRLQSKLALSATAALLLGGTALFFVFEAKNPATLGSLPFGQKLLGAFFQSVTTRTAGFAALPQEALTPPSVFVSLLLMFIGGSPVGTAGGVKTVTVFVLAATAASSVKNRQDVSVFGRSVSPDTVKKAAAVAATSFAILSLSTLALGAATDCPLADLLYETVSATATVGLTRGLTPTLPEAGKWIVIVNMYLGRVGPISLAAAFSLRRESENVVKNPTEPLSVG